VTQVQITLGTPPVPNAVRDAEIRRLAFEEGMSRKDLATFAGTTESRITQILNVGSVRESILAYLAGVTGGVNAREIATELSLDINRVQYMVDSLRKKGLITAQLGTNGGQGDHKAFYNIRLKKRPPKTTPTPTPTPTPAPTNIPTAPTDTATLTVVVPEEPAAPVQVPVQVLAQPVPVLLAEYPLLRRLILRDGQIQQAATLLESAGLDDLALQALGFVGLLSPLEKEYVAFATAFPDFATAFADHGPHGRVE